MDSEEALKLIYDCLEEGMYYRALLYVEDALRGEAEGGDYYLSKALAQIFHQTGQNGRALIYAERALALAPAESRRISWFQVGRIRTCLYNEEHALVAFEKAIQVAPLDADAYVWAASTMRNKGDIDRARQYLLQGIECAIGSVDEAYLNLAILDLIEGDLEGARESIETALYLDPEYQDAMRLKEQLGFC